MQVDSNSEACRTILNGAGLDIKASIEMTLSIHSKLFKVFKNLCPALLCEFIGRGEIDISRRAFYTV